MRWAGFKAHWAFQRWWKSQDIVHVAVLLHADQQDLVLEEEGNEKQYEHKNTAYRELDNRYIRVILKLIFCSRREKELVEFES